MDRIKVVPEALKNAAAGLAKNSREWFAETETMENGECRKFLEECGNIIAGYAELLEKAGAEYEDAGSKFVSGAGDIYDEIRKI